jgi:hypothetical protein
MWAKLRAVVEGARLATRELWRRPTKARKPVQKKRVGARKKKEAAA